MSAAPPPEHKLRQWAYLHLRRPERWEDDIETLGYAQDRDEAETVANALAYLRGEDPPLSFPSKSLGVAVLYAHWIEERFGTPLLASLDDPELFWGSDRHFRPYSDARALYDAILAGAPQLPSSRGAPPASASLRKTLGYFLEEFSA